MVLVFCVLSPLRDMKAPNIVKALVDRSPEQIVSDNESYFNSKVTKEMCFCWGVTHINTSPYYPRLKNLVERLNKRVKVALRIFHDADQRRWDSNVPELNMALNSVPHSSTGFSPSKVFLGRELSVDGNLWGKTCINLEKARKSVERKYNKDRLENPSQVNDLVVCRHFAQKKMLNIFLLSLCYRMTGITK
ncbi:hypothetical protein PR048_009445 [Dryococelus australis]|uniref:Integrase catalytic domain-containing protein n=1 Tax=Dryococelus australis TaxID=614101 RepID=A0ABQ9HZW2_9NEOP|nr:hypothetical protein PR048_009445 [Dryococelus australis]